MRSPQAPVHIELAGVDEDGSCTVVVSNKDHFQSTAWLDLR